MNYNDYDSNGNEKSFNFDLTDKKQRARFILLLYFVLFVILVIVIRASGVVEGNKLDNNETNTTINDNTVVDNPPKEELKEDFSLIDTNNYEFTITLNYEGKEYVSIGKRYDNKIAMDYQVDNVSYKYLGTMASVKIYDPSSNEYKSAELPYLYINYYDTNLIKNIISKSKVVDEIYVISTQELSNISGHEVDESASGLNYFALDLKNNKVVGMSIDITNAVNDAINSNSIVKVKIEYTNFNLVDDFSLEVN